MSALSLGFLSLRVTSMYIFIEPGCSAACHHSVKSFPLLGFLCCDSPILNIHGCSLAITTYAYVFGFSLNLSTLSLDTWSFLLLLYLCTFIPVNG